MNSNRMSSIDFLSNYSNSQPGGPMFRNVPIELLENVRTFFKEKNIKIRVRYRGPRNDPQDTRPLSNRKQDCLKRFANRFHVYYDNNVA
jgi:hypothetical protein